MTQGLVAVIIVSLNRKYLLRACIESIQRQSYLKKEIIVIDDNSNDGTYSYIKTFFPEVEIYKNSRNYGPAHSRNLGIKKSNGEYILFLDSDTEFIDTYAIENMVNILKSDSGIAEIGGEGFFNNGILKEIHGVNINFGGCSVDAFIDTKKLAQKTIMRCIYVPTSNCMLKKTKILEIGGFDPYFIYPSEDKDLGYRLYRAGYINAVATDTGALHKISKIAEDRNRFYHVTRNRVRFLIKNRGILFIVCALIYDLFKIYNFIKYQLYIIKNWLLKCGDKVRFHGRPYTQDGSKVVAYIRAYLWNIFQLRMTLKCRKINFLSDNEIYKFEKNYKIYTQ